MKFALHMAAIVALGGCASEAFDAPLDQNGAAPAKLCADAAEAGFANCILYDAFGGGLDRWHVHDPVPEDATVSLLAVSSDGREGILQLGDCPEKAKPSVASELRLKQAGPFTIRAAWRSAEADGAVLRMFVDDSPLEFALDATESPPAWMATTANATAASATPVLRLEAESRSSTLCANTWVDWIAVEQ